MEPTSNISTARDVTASCATIRMHHASFAAIYLNRRMTKTMQKSKNTRSKEPLKQIQARSTDKKIAMMIRIPEDRYRAIAQKSSHEKLSANLILNRIIAAGMV